VPGLKDEQYTITPLTSGQLNIAYYEQLAEITDANGHSVGMCVVELLDQPRDASHRRQVGTCLRGVSLRWPPPGWLV
jgi:hypothetical protein